MSARAVYESLVLHVYINKVDLEHLLVGQPVLCDLFVRGDVVCYRGVSVQLQYDALERLPAFVQREREIYGKPPAPEFHPPHGGQRRRKKGVRRGKKPRPA